MDISLEAINWTNRDIKTRWGAFWLPNLRISGAETAYSATRSRYSELEIDSWLLGCVALSVYLCNLHIYMILHVLSWILQLCEVMKIEYRWRTEQYIWISNHASFSASHHSHVFGTWTELESQETYKVGYFLGYLSCFTMVILTCTLLWHLEAQSYFSQTVRKEARNTY